jgi:hypothetical protein
MLGAGKRVGVAACERIEHLPVHGTSTALASAQPLERQLTGHQGRCPKAEPPRHTCRSRQIVVGFRQATGVAHPRQSVAELRDKVSFAPIDKLSFGSFDELSLTWIDKLS